MGLNVMVSPRQDRIDGTPVPRLCLLPSSPSPPLRTNQQVSEPLEQRFSTFLMLRPFNSAPRVVVTPTTPTIKLFYFYPITVILLLLWTIMTVFFDDLRQPLWKGCLKPQGSQLTG